LGRGTLVPEELQNVGLFCLVNIELALMKLKEFQSKQTPKLIQVRLHK
jgi:hypothetical protein